MYNVSGIGTTAAMRAVRLCGFTSPVTTTTVRVCVCMSLILNGSSYEPLDRLQSTSTRSRLSDAQQSLQPVQNSYTSAKTTQRIHCSLYSSSSSAYHQDESLSCCVSTPSTSYDHHTTSVSYTSATKLPWMSRPGLHDQLNDRPGRIRYNVFVNNV